MSYNAVGFNPGRSVMRGLAGTSAYGKAMAGAAGLNLEANKANSGFALEQEKVGSEQRQQAAQNSARNQANSQERATQQMGLNSRQKNMRLGNMYDYDQLNKRKTIDKQQTVLGHLLGD
jgi:pyruvoyl-dependent arginine decarboxylase (PvlArgDC)